jgi:tetratricopeptide (TPR) repeat protein
MPITMKRIITVLFFIILLAGLSLLLMVLYNHLNWRWVGSLVSLAIAIAAIIMGLFGLRKEWLPPSLRKVAARLFAAGLLPPMTDKAVSYYKRGRYAAAERLFNGALEVSEEIWGPDHPSTKDIRENLAELYKTQGRYTAAGPLSKKAKAVVKKPEKPYDQMNGKTEANLKSLLVLSKDTAKKEAAAITNWRDTKLRSLELTEQARTYCSRTVVKDLTKESLVTRDHILMQWRLDFVRPDRWHITQEAWDGDLGKPVLDEWVTIGRENYRNSGPWVPKEDGRNAELNQSLLSDNILDIVRNEEPVSSEVYQYKGHRYLLLQYNPPVSGELRRGFLEICKALEGDCQIQIWISLDTGFLVKCAILFQGKTLEGEFVHGESGQNTGRGVRAR